MRERETREISETPDVRTLLFNEAFSWENQWKQKNKKSKKGKGFAFFALFALFVSLNPRLQTTVF